MKQKINAITNLTQRCLRLSDDEFHEERLKYVRNAGLLNGFPDNIVHAIIVSVIRKLHDSSGEGGKKPNKYMSTNYICR